MSRTAAIILISFAIACWPGHNMIRAFFGMLTYSVLAMLYLAYVGVNGTAGILLWPGVRRARSAVCPSPSRVAKGATSTGGKHTKGSRH